MVKVFTGAGIISAAKSFTDVAVRAQSALGDDDLTKSVHVAMKAGKLNSKLGTPFDNDKDEHPNPSINISMADILNDGADELTASGISSVPTDLANAYSGFKTDIQTQLDAAAEQLFDEESMDDSTIDGAEVLRLLKEAGTTSTLNVNNLNELFRRSQDLALNGRQPGAAGGVSAGFVAGDVIHVVGGMELSMAVNFAAESVNTDASNENLSTTAYSKKVTVDLALKVEDGAAV
jgi:hypothetical protein